MADLLSVNIICQDEQETLPYTFFCIYQILRPYLAEIVVVDGGSLDETIDVIEYWSERLPITLLHRPYDTAGKQKNFGLDRCTGKFVLGLDADNSFTCNLGWHLRDGYFDSADVWDFPVYTPVDDMQHTYQVKKGRGGPHGMTTRLWRNDGRRYEMDFHEQIKGQKGVCPDAYILEHVLLQSRYALLQRGIRWQKFARELAEAGCGPGPPTRYVDALDFCREHKVELPKELWPLIPPRDGQTLVIRVDEWREQENMRPMPKGWVWRLG